MNIFDKLKVASEDVDTQSSKPNFYRLSQQSDKEALESILVSHKPIVHDEIESQVRELIKLRNPSQKFLDDELSIKTEEYIAANGGEEFGVWVFYPWSNRLVRILEEDEFIEVRTNRNYYKITPLEFQKLRKKVVGVIGLSVGQSVAVTLASERVFGEIRIADFDTLELTNLNRIRSGLNNLGLLKTIMVSREILEIDPYLNVKLFSEGLKESTYKKFIGQGNNKIDLIIDECDGLDVKIRIREIARNEKIPVLMDSSDRGMLDIERFDQIENLPLLHGLVDGFKISEMLNAKTNEEKVPFVAPILGIETMTTRMKYSLLEIEESISTWPQLASSVTLGGGVTCHIARKILLNEEVNSGRYFVDLDNLDYIKHDFDKPLEETEGTVIKPMDLDVFLEDFKSKKMPNSYLRVDKKEIVKIVESAGMAPSGGNSQPWAWISDGTILSIYLDRSRGGGLLDYNNLGSILACGASFENAIISAEAMGYEIDFSISPNGKELGRIIFVRESKDIKGQGVYRQIGRRYTNRNVGKRKKIPNEIIEELKCCCSEKPWRLEFIDHAEGLDRVSSILEKVERARIFSKQGHSDFVSELRWNEKQVKNTRDGIDINTLGINNIEKVGISVARDWEVIKGLRDLQKGEGFDKLMRKSVAGAGAVGLLISKAKDKKAFFEAGRIIQRIWLTAGQNSVSFQPLTPATFLFAKLRDNDLNGLDPYSSRILVEEYEKFMDIWGLAPDECAVFLFRLCYAPEMKVKSLRRHLDDYFLFSE